MRPQVRVDPAQAMTYDSILKPLQDVCVLVTFVYFLSRKASFRRLLSPSARKHDRVWLFAFFAVLALVEVLLNPNDSPENFRIASVTVAGLLGGPVVGLSLGVFVSLISLLILGPEMAHSGLASAIGGLLGGWVAQYRPQLQQKVLAGFVVGALSHTLWLGVVFSQDTLVGSWDALALMYGPPILMNGAAVAFFLMVMGDMRAQQERIERAEVARALRIANRVLPHMKYGLNAKSADYIAGITRGITGVSDVVVSVPDGVLASDGDGLPVGSSISALAQRAMRSGVPEHAGDALAGCALPLFYENKVVGCVELYEQTGRKLPQEVIDLGQEVAQFLSSYEMQLADLELKSEVASKAELRALEAQVHPHFLFNALNTVAYLCQSDPEKASRIAVQLGAHYRAALHRDRPILIALEEEMANVRRYLEIEQARFGDRLSVSLEIEQGAESAPVPSLSLQPVVENAVLHGLSKKPGRGSLRVVVRRRGGRLRCLVSDDGVGMSLEAMRSVLSQRQEPHGLSILKNRLDMIYQGQARIAVRGRPGCGTVVLLSVPLKENAI